MWKAKNVFIFYVVLHGVSPDKMLHYKIDTAKFKCLDGKKFISFNAINDNYCDCDDGSDEPGTSACSNGRCVHQLLLIQINFGFHFVKNTQFKGFIVILLNEFGIAKRCTRFFRAI